MCIVAASRLLRPFATFDKMAAGRTGSRDFTGLTESIPYSTMENEDNEINIDHDNREEKEGEKVNMVHRIQVEGKKVSP